VLHRRLRLSILDDSKAILISMICQVIGQVMKQEDMGWGMGDVGEARGEREEAHGER
jgi:hypothetical protein